MYRLLLILHSVLLIHIVSSIIVAQFDMHHPEAIFIFIFCYNVLWLKVYCVICISVI